MSRHLRNEKTSKSVSKTWLVINSGFLALYTILAGFFIFKMYSHQFLAFRYVNIILTVVLIAVFVFSLIFLLRRRAKIGTTIFLLLFALVATAGLYLVQSTVEVAEKLNHTASYSEIEMSVVVPTGSSIQDIAELGQVQAPVHNDSENIQALINDLKVNKNLDLAPEVVDSYQQAYDNLLSGTTQGMILNSAYVSLLELSDLDYASKIRTLYTFKITKEINVSPAENQAEQDSNVVNIYISGIDTYGSISTVSRSDVNIIMTINMNTHKILLTTTPRDAYVQIPDGGGDQYDKLTHAGIYGVETSMKTLERLYDVNIDYYARINFTSFLQLIDVIGGIEVYNDQEFVSHVGGYTFPAGNVMLNSEHALAFVRERYSLQAGDADRGRNQQKVISAIINKLASVNSIANFTNIINSLQQSIQTNMPYETMMHLANKQLSSGGSFVVSSQDVTGSGSTGQLPSYAMPSAALYMLSLDETSVETAKQAIKNTMEGN